MSNTVVVADTAQVLISEDQAFAVALQAPQAQVAVEQSGPAVIAVMPAASTAVVQEQVVQAVALQMPAAPAVVEVITQGPQGVAGDATGLPTGGDPGNVLVKNSYGNYDAAWAGTVDGGTFN